MLLSDIKFRSRFGKCSFGGFFKRFALQVLFFFVFFRDNSVLLLKKCIPITSIILFLSLERLIIVLCKSVVINLPWFPLKSFCFIWSCLLRKCWKFYYQGNVGIPCCLYHILISLLISHLALNSSLQNFR